ncbi:MAG: spermidine synthase family protein, partial [Planctomycetota bacterium]
MPRFRGSAAAFTIFFFSGVAGLGYEIVWARMFGAGLGHEMPGVLAVVGAFFAGLALGAWALDGIVSRSRYPGRWYAALELLIAAWAVASIVLIPALNDLASRLIGVSPTPLRHWLVALAIPLLGLLPATAAMGATFAAMDRLASRLRGSGATISGLYAVNTAGAVAGTLATTFLVMPAFGYGATVLTLAAVNVACAAATLLGPATGESGRAEVVHDLEDPPGRVRLGLTVLATGLLGIGYEVLGVRVISQVLENTVYSFASALSVYLLGTAVGAAGYQRLAGKRRFAAPLGWLLPCLSLACMVGVVAMSGSEAIYTGARRALGGSIAASIGAEMIVALVVFGPPTVLMGAVFGHLVQAARGREKGVGRALGLNTLGGAAAPALLGVAGLSALGSKWTLVLVSLAYLALLPRRAVTVARLVPAAAAAAIVLTLPPSLMLVTAPIGQRIVAAREGVMASVVVTEDDERRRLLKVNSRFFMGGTVHSFADRRQAHIPLLLHPAPRRALFLGLGSGITVGAA